MVGRTISHYQVEEKLGGGAMGVVYRAVDLTLDRPVALKFLPPEFAHDETAKERFIQEAKAASRLDHPHIATVYEIGETDSGRLFIVMPLYRGETLKQKIARGPVPLEEVIDYAEQITDGLQAAHEAGIIHRDIKPANVMVTEEGRVKIVDFGLAKMAGVELTKAARTVGTAAYMSPEQVRGEDVDHRTDLWSLGVVIYEMLTGERPFGGTYEQAVFYSILNEEPTPARELRPDVPEVLDTLIMRCLHKRPDERHRAAADLKTALDELLLEETPEGRTATANSPVWSRRAVRRAAGLLLVILLFAGTVGWFIIDRAPLDLFGIGEGSMTYASVPQEKHIAVLPFASPGGDSATRAFSDGLIDVLSSRLTQLARRDSTLWIIPVADIRKRSVESVAEARDLFGATLVVTGTLWREGRSVRMTLNLTDASTLRQIESEVIDASLDDVSRFRNQVATTLTQMFAVEPPEELPVLADDETTVPGAYDFYVQGKGYLQRYESVENIDTAIELFERALAADSSYASALAGLGEAYWRKYEATGNVQWVDTARRYGERAAALSPRSVPVQITLGLIYRGTGRYEQAVEHFERALELDPENTDAYREMARAYEELEDLEAAETAYENAIKLQTDYWAGYDELGRFYFKRGRYEEALEQFRQVVELSPQNALAYNQLGAAYSELKQWEEAEQMFQKSVAIEPSYRAYMNLGTFYFYHAQHYEKAAQAYEEALKLNEGDFQVWALVGEAYLQVPRRIERAREAFREAARLAEEEWQVNPRDAEVPARLASYYASLGDRQRAIDRMEEALALAPENRRVLMYAGLAAEELGERERAIELIQRAIEAGYDIGKIERVPALEDVWTDLRSRSNRNEGQDNF